MEVHDDAGSPRGFVGIRPVVSDDALDVQLGADGGFRAGVIQGSALVDFHEDGFAVVALRHERSVTRAGDQPSSAFVCGRLIRWLSDGVRHRREEKISGLGYRWP